MVILILFDPWQSDKWDNRRKWVYPHVNSCFFCLTWAGFISLFTIENRLFVKRNPCFMIHIDIITWLILNNCLVSGDLLYNQYLIDINTQFNGIFRVWPWQLKLTILFLSCCCKENKVSYQTLVTLLFCVNENSLLYRHPQVTGGVTLRDISPRLISRVD